ncbi:MAG: type II toxin-antitoxin system VapC family toxin [Chromatiales bacterium]|nr:type II toxin-antitoxin system VapC family toxin [Chromatiales bacterium]
MKMASRKLWVAEPPAAYALRSPLVVDASVVAALVFEESDGDKAEAMLAARVLHAPFLLDHEMASVALRKLQREQLSASKATSALGAYARMGIECHAVDVAGVVELARRYGLTAYDAAYLWVAEQVGAPLATFDQQLAKAAREHLAGGDRVHDTG